MRYHHPHALLPPDAVELIKRALRFTDDEYDAGPSYISATSLVGEPLQRQLLLRYGNDLESDVLDSTWSLFGSSLHAVLERAESESDEDIHERRFYSWFPVWPGDSSTCCGAKTQPITGEGPAAKRLRCSKCMQACSWVVSGQADMLSGSVLYDFKCTSSWAFRLTDEEVKSEWEGQLNVLAALIRRRHWWFDADGELVECEGRQVNGVRVFAFIRDFSPGQAERATQEAGRTGNPPDYPLTPMLVVAAHLWDLPTAEAYVAQRLAVHVRYDGVQVQRVPECSPGMRWHKPDSWAVFKTGADGKRLSRATKVFSSERGQTERDAWNFADTLKNEGKDAFVESRPGEDTKCAHYCSVRTVCPYGKPRAVMSRIADNAKEREALGFEVKRWPS